MKYLFQSSVLNLYSDKMFISEVYFKPLQRLNVYF